MTLQVIFRLKRLGMVLAVIKTGFTCLPDLPALLKTTFNFPSLPGGTASFGKLGMVHPQVELAPVMMSGLDPVFLKRKS
jgi:hypothetical protein